MHVEQRGKDRSKRGPQRKGSGGPPQKKKTKLQMVQSELFWSFIHDFFFFESGATPVFPEQLAALLEV